MPQIHALKAFTFSDDGFTIVEYAGEQDHEVSDACATVAIREGWARPADVPKPTLKAKAK